MIINDIGEKFSQYKFWKNNLKTPSMCWNRTFWFWPCQTQEETPEAPAANEENAEKGE